MSLSNLQIKLNEIAILCFRNIADNDYISARTLFRYELFHQAYWCSLQAIEKYLKAILLFNGKSIINISKAHDLNVSLKEINIIKEIKFNLPSDVLTFINAIDYEGANRYFEYPYEFEQISLFKLDKTVWHIRKYCFCLKGQVKYEESLVDLLPFNLIEIENKKYAENPHKYKINGELENILQDKNSLKRKQLIWNNKYYGSRKKSKISLNYVKYIGGNPPHFLDENIFDDIKKYVKFSQRVKEYFKKRHK
jgi:HEPN domain-containing protein